MLRSSLEQETVVNYHFIGKSDFIFNDIKLKRKIKLRDDSLHKGTKF